MSCCHLDQSRHPSSSSPTRSRTMRNVSWSVIDFDCTWTATSSFVNPSENSRASLEVMGVCDQ
ncbi:hypothetical protein ACFFX0_26915 [Citricoccus parietis]|uniref:Uncharacterized protein n=1 Tax=Citricoccus parietis TaxID=592307 RepID=A0ABV5G6R0_9MICC